MSGKDILIVEDATVIGEHIKMLVEAEGYNVPAVSATAEEALEKVEEFTPALVLMDIQLIGDMDGIEATHQIREQYNDQIDVVYITAYGDQATLQRARESGARALFTKPVKKNALIWILNWVFDNTGNQSEPPGSLQAWFFEDDKPADD
ncbi:MAG: response regulator [bacterium]